MILRWMFFVIYFMGVRWVWIMMDVCLNIILLLLIFYDLVWDWLMYYMIIIYDFLMYNY